MQCNIQRLDSFTQHNYVSIENCQEPARSFSKPIYELKKSNRIQGQHNRINHVLCTINELLENEIKFQFPIVIDRMKYLGIYSISIPALYKLGCLFLIIVFFFANAWNFSLHYLLLSNFCCIIDILIAVRFCIYWDPVANAAFCLYVMVNILLVSCCKKIPSFLGVRNQRMMLYVNGSGWGSLRMLSSKYQQTLQSGEACLNLEELLISFLIWTLVGNFSSLPCGLFQNVVRVWVSHH